MPKLNGVNYGDAGKKGSALTKLKSYAVSGKTTDLWSMGGNNIKMEMDLGNRRYFVYNLMKDGGEDTAYIKQGHIARSGLYLQTNVPFDKNNKNEILSVLKEILTQEKDAKYKNIIKTIYEKIKTIPAE